MNHIKVHSQGLGSVPFHWENKPGVCKPITSQEEEGEDYPLHKLLPPPPPCALHPPSRTSSRRGLRKSSDDPFLAAYKECTKSTTSTTTTKGKQVAKKIGMGMGMFSFSCKQSCSVVGNLVRISQLPLERDSS